MKPLTLLEMARKTCQPPTWYRLARTLDVSDQVLSTWRRRGGTYDDEAACELAKMLGKSLEEVLAIREAEHAKSETKRRRWRVRLSHFALVTMLVGTDSELFPALGAGSSRTSPANKSWPCSLHTGKRTGTTNFNCRHNLYYVNF